MSALGRKQTIQWVLLNVQGDRAFKAGDVIFVPAGEMHQFQNTGADPLKFICLIPAPQDCTK